MKTVRDRWESFARAVMPADAPPGQRREMRRAFYAGCWSIIQAFDDDASAPPDGGGVSQLRAFEDELKAFYRLLRQGRA